MIPIVKKLSDTAIWPTKAYEGDAGFDVYSDSEDVTLGFGERHRFKLGFALELHDGWVALIQEKSGTAVENGIFTIGNVIDSGYRGEVHAILCCLNSEPVTIRKGQKVAQMLILPCYTGMRISASNELSPSSRGRRGFGSSGLEATDER